MILKSFVIEERKKLKMVLFSRYIEKRGICF